MFRWSTSSIAAAAAVALVVQPLVPAPAAAANYTVGILESSVGVQIALQQQTTPPATISGTWQNPLGPTTHYVHSYFARASRTSIDLRADVDLYTYYANYTDVHESGGFRWDDVVFTCLDGRPSVDVGINLDIHGRLSHVSAHPPDVGPPSAGLAVYLGSPGDPLTHRGIWYPASNISMYNYPSTGVFAGLSGDTLDGRFSYSLGPHPTGTAVTIEPATLTLSFGAHNGRVKANFDEETTGKPGMALPTDGPVFDLPGGCTCNSPEMGVVENRLVSFGVIGATPAYGGDDGAATVSVRGTGFREGAAVRLRRAGSADIVGSYPAVSTDGTRITAHFDLRGADQGSWDVLVQNTDGITATKAEGFQVQAGRAARLTLAASGGRNGNIRVNDLTPFTIYVTNHGNTDANSILLGLSGPPEVADWIPDFEEIVLPGAPPGVPGDAPFALAVNGVQRTALIIPSLPPGASFPVRFKIRTPNLDPFRIHARALGPLSSSTAGLGVASIASNHERLCGAVRCFYGVNGLAACIGQDLSLPVPCLDDFVEDLFNRFCTGYDDFLRRLPQEPRGAAISSDRVVNALSSIRRNLSDAFDNFVACTITPDPEPAAFADAVNDCLADLSDNLDDAGACCEFLANTPGGNGAQLQRATAEEPYDGSCGLDIDFPVNVVTAWDPNEKTGNHTNSSAGYVPSEAGLGYQIFFENLSAATAPARVVEITDPLSPLLNQSSLQWGPIRIANHLVVPDPFTPAMRETLDLRPQTDLLVAIDGDLVGGVMRWRFTSLDPDTKQPPADPLAGFLPPNLNPPEGEGSVSMLLRANPGLATSTEILNSASIIFDGNPPILTGTVVHRIDADAPQTLVQGLPATVADPVVPLAILHGDLGSGLKDLTLLVSEDDGPYTPLPSSGPVSEVAFIGVPGHRYAFYSVGRDSAGNLELPPATPDATTTIDGSTPALLIHLTAESNAAGIELHWGFGEGSDVARVNVERAVSEAGPWSQVDVDLRTEGAGTVAMDNTVQPGETYWYRLQATFSDGSTQYFGPVSVRYGSAITEFSLTAVAPNPTSAGTRIDFALPAASRVRLTIHDIQGREIALLSERDFEAGAWTEHWDGKVNGRAAPAGLYFVRFEAGGRQLVRRMSVTR